MPRISQADNATRKALLERSLSDWYNVVHYGADPAGVSDSRSGIQDAIDAAASAGGGTVYIPEGIYLVSAPLVLSDKHGVTLLGSRPAPALTQVCPDLAASISTGAWLRPVKLGVTNGIEINTDTNPAQDDAVSNAAIINLGFYCFAECIKGGAFNRLSFGFGRLQDLFFVGNDRSTVYTAHALNLRNFQHTQINHVKAWNCLEPFRFAAAHSVCSPGNSVIIEPYCYMNNLVSGDFGIGLIAEAGSQALNALTIIRPQVNWFQAAAPRSGKANIKINGAGGASSYVVQCGLYDCDLEGPNDAHIESTNAAHIYIGVAGSTTDATATIKLSNHSGIIMSANPSMSINATDDFSAQNTMVMGRIKQMLGIHMPGFRYEQVSNSFVSGFAHNGRYLTFSESHSENCARLVNMQFVEEMTEYIGSGNQGTLGGDVAGTILVNCNHSTIPITFYLPAISSVTYGIEYVFILKNTSGAACEVRSNTGDTLEGGLGYNLIARWQKVRVKACNDNATWIVLYGDGVKV